MMGVALQGGILLNRKIYHYSFNYKYKHFGNTMAFRKDGNGDTFTSIPAISIFVKIEEYPCKYSSPLPN